ncbi:hypothetical protein ACLB2K_013126 [Fragaria x ananassa]
MVVEMNAENGNLLDALVHHKDQRALPMPGYERLCCLRCMQPRDHNFATTCVCRVPKHLREEKDSCAANRFLFQESLYGSCFGGNGNSFGDFRKACIFQYTLHPPLGNLELNFDGSVLSNYGSAGGFVFRDVTGKPILAAANSLPTSDILIVEALASRAGFHAAWLHGFSHLEVEGDSKLLIDSLVWSHQYSFDDSNLDLEY